MLKFKGVGSMAIVQECPQRGTSWIEDPGCQAVGSEPQYIVLCTQAQEIR